MIYPMTTLEDVIEELYLKLGVIDPDHPIEDVAERLGITLFYFEKPPFTMRNTIILDPRLPKELQKEIFAHELAHALFHSGAQVSMPESFRLKQESQAKNFSLHFCIPTFLLREMKFPEYRSHAVSMIAETFQVTNGFAEARLQHYENQIAGAMFHKKIIISHQNMTN
ncbi:ImmA/IrrE family metallo-endopeptidase [Oceanobacillus sp. CF4.6]|uniref:ImmA/IrrE family metallo-endopeptidase n=1 Tax=Oceanobacillus sp. CF4.6 TaxID=3373080 RepID=UPI003EE59E81